MPGIVGRRRRSKRAESTSDPTETRKYKEAIPIAERAVEVAKRARGTEAPESAEALNNLGLLFKKIGDYAKAEPLPRKHSESDRRF